MLIFISDLHLMDGTAGAYYLPASAFVDTFRALALRAQNARAQDVKIVFLGDVYSLLVTTEWFRLDPKERPWGEQPSADAALRILNGIIDRHAETLAILSGSLVDQFGFPTEPQRVYLPGNHDRLCNRYPALRRRVCETLGITPTNPDRFDHFFVDPEHGVYARHGHEWDPYNFEGSLAFRHREYVEVPYDDYMQTPIGDVVATEIVARLPTLARENLPEGCPDRAQIYRNFCDLFEVRPLAAIIPWLYDQMNRHSPTVQNAINKAVQQAAADFEAIPFVQEWMNKHDRLLHPFDPADRLQLLLLLLRVSDLTRFDRAMPLLEKASQLCAGDNFASKAAEDFQRLDTVPEWKERILYVLYGHTHVPDQRAIDVFGPALQPGNRVYLNTGTWRPYQRQALTKRGFVQWKNLTYVIIYKRGETLADGRLVDSPVFETWTGGLNAGDPSEAQMH
jgi:UDP-2,3-diacylglucosamine pyrophosphatase LpxH